MSKATYKVLVDWNNDGDYTDTYDDITTYVISCSWSRGRDYASQLTGKSTAGTITVVLNNESKIFSSFNVSSPIYGSILPGRRIRVQGIFGGETYTLWTGRLLRIIPHPATSGLQEATLEGIGVLGYYNQNKVNVPMYLAQPTGALIGVICFVASGDIGLVIGLDIGTITVTRYWVDDNTMMYSLGQIEDTEGGFVLEASDGRFAFEDRAHRTLAPHTISQVTFSDAPGASLGYTGIMQDDPLIEIYNEFKAEVQLFTVESLAVLWTLSETGVDSPAIATHTTQIFWASYPNAESASEAIGVDAWTTPIATTDFTAYTTPSGAGSDITGDIIINTTKFSTAMKIEVYNGNAATAYIRFLQARGTPLFRSNSTWYSAEDAVSQGKYGIRTYPNPAQFLPSASTAQVWCNTMLAKYKDPHPILSFSVLGNIDDNHMTQVLTRNISDRITIVANGESGLGINADFFIEAEHHKVEKGGIHTVTWECSPCPIAYFIPTGIITAESFGTTVVTNT